MERINKILNHPIYQECYQKIQALEKERIYCRHNIEHFLAAARIAYIINLEQKLDMKKETIYACALLHDIGKHLQYTEGIPHEEASARLSRKILDDCGFETLQKDEILSAIRTHRDGPPDSSGRKSLNAVLYEADKRSRDCLFCQAKDSCKWNENMKRQRLEY